MRNLIEQAALRLEQLRRAGAVISDATPSQRLPGGGHSAAGPDSEAPPPAPTVVSRQVAIDFNMLTNAGILVPNAPRSMLADQIRVIKRPLIRNAMGKGASELVNGNLIMITSALAGEGKSFMAVNLAMSIATELDHTVMLVDADVERPAVSRMFGLATDSQASFGPGLLDVLGGQAEMSEALVKTNVDKLTLLPSGRHHEHATELLASEAMTRLLEQMATRYPDRIIIFDSPPLLQTTEARVLATHMGQIVLVVQAEKTLQSNVQHALATIESCPVRLLVLNRAQTSGEAAYGYGYDGYGYGYGYSYGADRAAGAGDNVPQASTA